MIKYLGGRGCPCVLVHKWLELLGIRMQTNVLKLHLDSLPFGRMVSPRVGL